MFNENEADCDMDLDEISTLISLQKEYFKKYFKSWVRQLLDSLPKKANL